MNRRHFLRLACGPLAGLALRCTPKADDRIGSLPMRGLDLSTQPPARIDPGGRAGRHPWAVPAGRRWRWIVVHHSATQRGSAATFDRAHRRRGWDELGYHFVIDNGLGGPDGRVEVGSRWRSQKWGAHTGGTPDNAYNEYGIGICLVGDFTRRMPTRRQLASLDRLTAFLISRYRLTPGDVLGHRDAPNATTTCPGNRLHAYVHGPMARRVRRHLDASGALT